MRSILIKLLAILQFSIAFIALLGWIFHVQKFISISNDWITMKIWTALGLLLSAVVIYFQVNWRKDRELKALGVAYGLSVIMMIWQIGLLFGAVVDYIHHNSSIFLFSANTIKYDLHHQMPSIVTVLVLTLFAASQTFQMLQKVVAQRVIAMLLIYIGTLCLLGYVFNVPQWYFDVPNKTTAVAVNTAVCYVLLGMGQFLLVVRKNNDLS